MKRVLYLTTTTIDNSSARSIQISNFTDVLSRICSLSVYSVNNNMRPAHFLKFLRSYFIEKPDAIVIREVKVLPFLIFRRVTIILELHQKPSIFATKFLLIAQCFSRIQLVSISDALRMELSGLGCKNIYVAHDGIDTDKNRLNIRNFNSGVINIVHTGSLYKINTEWLIGAVKSILSSNENYSITLVGLTEIELDIFRDLKLKGLHLLPRVEYLESLRLQNSADILWYINDPSSEISNYTSPLKLFEYFNTGRPVVCNRHGSIKEIIDFKYPYAYEYRSTESLLSVINNIAHNYTKASKVSAMYRNQLSENFSWKKRAEFFLSLI